MSRSWTTPGPLAHLHEQLEVELNADCAEFCPVPGSQSLLAVGTYQLDEHTRQRNGRLYLYRVLLQVPMPGNLGPPVTAAFDEATLDCAGGVSGNGNR
jgi:hypothetical protein